MYNFTEEQKLKIEKEILISGLEDAILNSKIAKNILSNDSILSKRIFELINSYDEFQFHLEQLDIELNKRNIKTEKK